MIADQMPVQDEALPGSTSAPVDPAAAAIGPYQKPDEELLSDLLAWFKEASDALKETRPKRRKDWSYYAGDQWEEQDRAIADKQKRPTLTLNMLLSIISAVEGEERTNRQEMKFYGEGQEDDDAAYGINRLVRWVMDQCGGQFSLSTMFRSGIACGEGWVVPEVDYFSDPNGKIVLLYVDDEEMLPDPLSSLPDGGDMRHVSRIRMMPADELEARWKGAAEKVRLYMAATNPGTETDGKGFRDVYSTPNDPGTTKLYDAQRKLHGVIETWWHQIEPGWVMVDEQTGLLVERSAEEFDGLRQEREQAQLDARRAQIQHALNPPPPSLEMVPNAMGIAVPTAVPVPPPEMPPPLQAMERPIRRFYQAFWAHGVLLEKKASPLPNMKRFPYVPFRGLWDKVKKEWFGIARPILDAQRQHNVEQSVIVQLMQLMPKQSWMGPKGVFHEKTKWQEQLAQPGSMLEYNAQRGKPEPIPVPTVPRHLIDMAFSRPQTMRDISGVNVDMMGQRTASDPGVVMEMRQKAAKTVLAPLFDNFRMSKMALGKVLLCYIQAYITPGRRIRVLGPEGQTYVPMTQDMALGDYDLTVEETNSTINDRMQTLTVMQTTLPQMMKAGVPIPASVVDLLPMQPHIRQEWKRQILWSQTLAGQLPPPDWQPGQPVPPPPLPAPGSTPPAEPTPPAAQ